MKAIALFFSLTFSCIFLFSQDLVPFKDKATNKFGYKNAKGKVVVPPKYDFADSLHEGMAAVNLGGRVIPGAARTDGGKWGFIDEKGKEIIEPQYDHCHSFSQGIAAVDTGGHTNENGIFVGGLWGYIDRYNAQIIPLINDFANDAGEEMVIVNRNGTYDETGKFSGDGNGTWFVLDLKGTEIFSFQCKTLFPYSEGMAKFLSEGKYGFINKAGEEIIPSQFEEASDFKNGEALVKKEGLEYYIDMKGELVP